MLPSRLWPWSWRRKHAQRLFSSTRWSYLWSSGRHQVPRTSLDHKLKVHYSGLIDTIHRRYGRERDDRFWPGPQAGSWLSHKEVLLWEWKRRHSAAISFLSTSRNHWHRYEQPLAVLVYRVWPLVPKGRSLQLSNGRYASMQLMSCTNAYVNVSFGELFLDRGKWSQEQWLTQSVLITNFLLMFFIYFTKIYFFKNKR